MQDLKEAPYVLTVRCQDLVENWKSIRWIHEHQPDWAWRLALMIWDVDNLICQSVP